MTQENLIAYLKSNLEIITKIKGGLASNEQKRDAGREANNSFVNQNRQPQIQAINNKYDYLDKVLIKNAGKNYQPNCRKICEAAGITNIETLLIADKIDTESDNLFLFQGTNNAIEALISSYKILLEIEKAG